MVLVDTSVWVDHIRRGDPVLGALLEQGRVLMHDLVLGELACGNLAQRADRLAALAALPRIGLAEHDEVRMFLERHQLFGSGIGFVDMHLLAAVQMQPGTRLYSLDKSLHAAAARLGLAHMADLH